MNQCPDAETILAFAEVPLNETNAEIAAHIISCPNCQREYRIALAAVSMEDAPITEEDLREAAENVAKVQKSNRLQQKFIDTLKYLCSKLEKCHFFLVERGELPLFRGDDCKLSFAAGRSDDGISPNMSYRKPAPVITFVSNCGESSPRFWTAELPLPRMMTADSKMDIKVTVAGKAKLARGTLVFHGIALPISDGTAKLTAGDFKNSLNGRGISVIFEDGTVSSGKITICQ